MGKRVAIALGLALMLALVTAGTTQAATTVGNANDSGPGSLRQAIADAPPGETIVLPAGTYTLTSGPLEIGKSLTISGHDDADTRVSGGHVSRVFEIGDGDVIIVGITISDGFEDEGENSSAGGISSFADSLTLREVTVSDNVASADGAPGLEAGYSEGGGIRSGSGKLAVIDSVITRNKASAVGGAGQNGYSAEGGGISASGPLEVVNSTIAGNVVDARGGQGPASPEQDAGNVSGAGLSTYQNESVTVTVTGTTISGNVADASAGPGGEAGSASAAGWSEVANDSQATIANTTIAANVARAIGSGGEVRGGGAYLRGGDPGTLTLLGSTISANVAELSPGGSLEGRNLVARQRTSIGNTIVADPSGATAAGSCLVEEGVTSLGFNIDGTDECGFHAAGDKVNTDPQLGPLQNNGGLTATMAPLGTSPAVDQGSSPFSTDQRGVVRPIDLPSIPSPPGANGSDIGAVELQPASALTLGKLKKNKKKGTATLTVTVPQPSAGTLVLEGKGLKKVTKAVAGQASFRLKVAAKGKVKKALRRKGKRKVAIKVIYTPLANSTATQTRKAKLLKKKAKHKKKRKQAKKPKK